VKPLIAYAAIVQFICENEAVRDHQISGRDNSYLVLNVGAYYREDICSFGAIQRVFYFECEDAANVVAVVVASLGLARRCGVSRLDLDRAVI
jgi:protein-disulfide isomerase-like protein with CxxC motif